MNTKTAWIVFWCCIIAFWGVLIYSMFVGNGEPTPVVQNDNGTKKDGPNGDGPKKEAPKKEAPKKDGPKQEDKEKDVPEEDKSKEKVSPAKKPPEEKTPAKQPDSKKASGKKPELAPDPLVAMKKPEPKKSSSPAKTPAKEPPPAKADPDKAPADKVADKKPAPKKETPEEATPKKAAKKTEKGDAKPTAKPKLTYEQAHDEYAKEVWTYLTASPRPYSQWQEAEDAVVLPLGPQPGPTAKYYLNTKAQSDPDALPHGSMVVAEQRDPAGKLATVTVWHRVEPGYNKKTDDWYWVHFDADGKVLRSLAH